MRHRVAHSGAAPTTPAIQPAASSRLKYDATAPTITAADPAAAANANGWFNRPVAFAFRGTDATSGVAACTGSDV